MTLTFAGPSLVRKDFPGLYEIEAIISTTTQRVEFKKFGDFCGVYIPARTELRMLDSKDQVDIRPNPREAFQPGTPWDRHNLIYFVGYAFWYYFNLPFCLLRPGVDISENRQQEGREPNEWNTLEIAFPEDLHTHSKLQKLDFDQEYRLRRMHYSVEVAGGGSALHHCYNHRILDGIKIPTFRFANLAPSGLPQECAFIIQILHVSTNRRTGSI